MSFHTKKEINESENGLSKSTGGAGKNSIFGNGISVKGANQEFFRFFQHQAGFTALLRATVVYENIKFTCDLQTLCGSL